jgi:DNA end-binding protein Ku
MKTIWKGSISFGLINIPVKIYTAVQESTLDLDMLDSKDHSNIKFKRVNENTGKEVAYQDIVKGYKLNGEYIVLDEDDFKAADALKTRTIEILNFTDQKEIDSIYYENPYYLEPEDQAVKAYALLRDSLRATGKVGVATFVLRNREALAVLKPYGKVIVLNRIRFTQEIRDFAELKLPEVSKTKTKEMEMANKLIAQLTEKFDISKYQDTYTAKLLKIIKSKAKGKKPVVPHMRVVHPQKDLMSMLKASLEGSRKRAS